MANKLTCIEIVSYKYTHFNREVLSVSIDESWLVPGIYCVLFFVHMTSLYLVQKAFS